MLIYLLRHGQTEYNAQKRYQGQRDIPLSPEGARAMIGRQALPSCAGQILAPMWSMFPPCSAPARRRASCSRRQSLCRWTA